MADLVQEQVDVIVTAGTPAGVAAKKATSTTLPAGSSGATIATPAAPSAGARSTPALRIGGAGASRLPAAGSNLIREIKHDGYRLMSRREPVGIRLITRRGNDWTIRFPLVVEAVNHLTVRSCLIDGEVVCCDAVATSLVISWFKSAPISADSPATSLMTRLPPSWCGQVRRDAPLEPTGKWSVGRR